MKSSEGPGLTNSLSCSNPTVTSNQNHVSNAGYPDPIQIPLTLSVTMLRKKTHKRMWSMPKSIFAIPTKMPNRLMLKER